MKPTKAGRNVALWALLGVSSLSQIGEAALVKAVEYVGDHVFLTANAAEIAALDSGQVPGWMRTGIDLWVHDAPAPGLAPVCRFYSERFAPRSQHFFTAFATECDAVRGNSDWIEEGVAFYVRMPDSQDACPSGSRALRRWHNNGRGGVPRHKLTPFGERPNGLWGVTPGGFLQAGWTREGVGFSGTAFCTHAGLDVAKAEKEHLDLMKATRWEFRAGTSLVVNVEFSPTIETFPAVPDSRHLNVTAGHKRGHAAWVKESGELDIWIWTPPGLTNQLLVVSFTGRNLVEGCYHDEDLDAGPVGGGPYWKPCQPVVGRRL